MNRLRAGYLTSRCRWYPALLLLVGCGDSTGPEALGGRYYLQSRQGVPLPVLLLETPDTVLYLTAGDIRLNADESCSTSHSWLFTEAGSTTTRSETEVCVWSNDDTGFSVTWPNRAPDKGRSTESGSIVGNVLTLTDRGVTNVYER